MLTKWFASIYEPLRVIDGVSWTLGLLAVWAYSIYFT